MNEDLYKFLKHRIEALEIQNKDLKKTINRVMNEMEQEIKAKDNKVIAEFMGYEDVDDLEYHKSWVWLMPVCQKIDQYLEDNIGNAGHFDDCLSCNDIDAKYKAVVKFINQLNN